MSLIVTVTTFISTFYCFELYSNDLAGCMQMLQSVTIFQLPLVSICCARTVFEDCCTRLCDL